MIRRRWFLVLAPAVVLIPAALLFTRTVAPSYTASASVVIDSDDARSARAINNEAVSAGRRGIVDPVRLRYGSVSSVVIVPSAVANAITIHVTGTNRAEVVDAANMSASLFIETRAQAIKTESNGVAVALRSAAAQIRERINAIDAEIAAVPTTVDKPPVVDRSLAAERAGLVDEEVDLTSRADDASLAVLAGSDSRVVNVASSAQKLSQLTRNLALGVAGAFVTAVALVVFAERFDRRIRADDDVRTALPSLPILARIGGRRRPRRSSRASNERLDRALRSVYAAVANHPTADVPAVQLAGVTDSAAVDFVAHGLARIAGAAGQRAAVVDAVGLGLRATYGPPDDWRYLPPAWSDSSAGTQNALRLLLERFDFVVLDRVAAPLSSSDRDHVGVPTVVVVNTRHDQTRQVQWLLHRLSLTSAAVVGSAVVGRLPRVRGA